MLSRVVFAIAVAAASLNAAAAEKPLGTIDSAVVSYNALSSTRKPVSFVDTRATDGGIGKDVVVLPAWLQLVPFTAEEARAIVTAYAAYEPAKSLPAKAKRSPGPLDYAVGVGALIAKDEQWRRSQLPPSNTGPILTEPKPARYRFSATPQWPSAKVHFTTVLLDLDTCVGAFYSAVTKAQEAQKGTDIERIRKSIIADFDYHVVGPDPRCMN